MSLTIRTINEQDLPEMYLISIAAHQAGYATFIPAADRARFDARYTTSEEGERTYIEAMKEKMADSSWLFWVAEDDGHVVGYTLAQRESDHILHKKGMFVHPEHQGGGIGSALFQASLEGIDSGKIDLVVIANNERAQHIYTKNGFVKVGTHPKTFFGAEQVIMELEKK